MDENSIENLNQLMNDCNKHYNNLDKLVRKIYDADQLHNKSHSDSVEYRESKNEIYKLAIKIDKENYKFMESGNKISNIIRIIDKNIVSNTKQSNEALNEMRKHVFIG